MYFWVLLVISMWPDGTQTMEQIERFDSRYSCEIMKDLFIEKYGLAENETIGCEKLDGS